MRLVGHLKEVVSVPPSRKTAQQEDLMTARVSDVYQLHGTASAIVAEDAALRDVIARLADSASLRGVFLVNSQGRLTGIVTRVDLLRWAHLQLFRGKGRHRATISEFFRIIDADKAKDIARGDSGLLSVREDDTLQVALDRMIQNEEDLLPVLNSLEQIVGDLRLSEVLQFVITGGRRRTEGRGNE